MKKSASIFIILSFVLPTNIAIASPQHAGKIYLQVESKGEAWYVHPDLGERHSLGRPSDALSLMQEIGLGITNEDLMKIPIHPIKTTSRDSDNDGLSDPMEVSLGTNALNQDSDGDSFSDFTEIEFGYNPFGSGRMTTDQELVDRLLGQILIQVETGGEAWYLNPQDQKRYFLGRPEDALSVMRTVGIGITNKDLATIPEAQKEARNENTERNTSQEDSVVAVACGEALLNEYKKEHRSIEAMTRDRTEFKAVYDCLKNQFKLCKPASGTMNTVITTNRIEILGVSNGRCQVKSTAIESALKETEGLFSICELDNDHSLFVSQFDLSRCTGSGVEGLDFGEFEFTMTQDTMQFTPSFLLWQYGYEASRGESATSSGNYRLELSNEGIISI